MATRRALSRTSLSYMGGRSRNTIIDGRRETSYNTQPLYVYSSHPSIYVPSRWQKDSYIIRLSLGYRTVTQARIHQSLKHLTGRTGDMFRKYVYNATGIMYLIEHIKARSEGFILALANLYPPFHDDEHE